MRLILNLLALTAADAVLAAPLIYCAVTGQRPRNFAAGQQRRRACAHSAGPCPRFSY